jgi:hypothetical protein
LVDGTLIEAWASHKSFRAKDGSDDGDGTNFHKQKRTNETHASTTDPDSRLHRKAAGREAKLSYMGHVTMENRNGLAVAGVVTHANGTAERRASLQSRRLQPSRRFAYSMPASAHTLSRLRRPACHRTFGELEASKSPSGSHTESQECNRRRQQKDWHHKEIIFAKSTPKEEQNKKMSPARDPSDG